MQLKDKNLLRTSSYINGQWISSDASFTVRNPANAQALIDVADSDEQAVQDAVAAAHKALPAWRSKTAKERAAVLRTWYNLVLEHADDLAAILTAEQGKPLAEAKGEIIYGANYLEWFAEEAKRMYGDVIPAPSSDKRVIVIKQGIGVVSSITPWNFPSAMITRKVAPALAAGCTFIVKPAQETPLSALALAELGERAGVPAGVFNVVVGTQSRMIGNVLTGDPRIAKFSFTGSTAVGKILLKQCADTVKKTSMELGGNAPFIVFDDADLDAAVQGAMISKFRNAGQTCVCTNRLLVQASVYDAFVEKLITATKALKMGAGDVAGNDLGPMITTKAVSDVETLVQSAIAAGAKVATGGGRSDKGDYFFEPTVLTNVTPDMDVVRQEIFGPVAPIMKFDTEEQAIAMANDTEVGLASYMYSRDIGRVWRVSEQLEYGMVGINEGIISNEMAPFGGVKESGSGREGSKYGLDDYTEIKYLCMGGI